MAFVDIQLAIQACDEGKKEAAILQNYVDGKSAELQKKQKQRDAFIRDFLDRDARDLRYYHLVFNNDKNSPERIAQMIAEYVPTG